MSEVPEHEPALTKREARQADRMQLKAMREHHPGVWERLKLSLSDRVCAGCGRSLYGFPSNTTSCSHVCRSRSHRKRHGAHTPGRRRNQLEGLATGPLFRVVWQQIHTGRRSPTARRTWYELGLIEPAYKSLKPTGHKEPRETNWIGHPENVAWVEAWRARTAPPVITPLARIADALANSSTRITQGLFADDLTAGTGTPLARTDRSCGGGDEPTSCTELPAAPRSVGGG